MANNNTKIGLVILVQVHPQTCNKSNTNDPHGGRTSRDRSVEKEILPQCNYDDSCRVAKVVDCVCHITTCSMQFVKVLTAE